MTYLINARMTCETVHFVEADSIEEAIELAKNECFDGEYEDCDSSVDVLSAVNLEEADRDMEKAIEF